MVDWGSTNRLLGFVDKYFWTTNASEVDQVEVLRIRSQKSFENNVIHYIFTRNKLILGCNLTGW